LFEAGEYDHIFDIDMGDGVMRKLPYDNGGNPLEAADKFIVREHLNRAYVEQICTFIKNNSIPYQTRDPSEKK
jgi:phospholipase A-2-activating protein